MNKLLYSHRTRGQGAEGAHIRGIADAFKAVGYDVEFVGYPGVDVYHEARETDPDATAEPAQEKTSSLFDRLKEISKKLPEPVFELLELAYNLVSLARMSSAMRGEPTSLIYERYSLFLFSTIWYAKRKGVPILIEVNDSVLVDRIRPLFFRSMAIAIEKWCFQNASGLSFISKRFLSIAQEAYGNIAPSVVCPNAANIDKFDPEKFTELRAKIRDELDISDSIVCGYSGAFVRWHGIDWFVEGIAPLLKTSAPNLKLLLIGDGVLYDSIKETVTKHGLEDRIKLTGRVRHADMPMYYAAMDYGILPDSNDYGSPMKLFESMAMAVPMVVPGFGPIDEVVEDNVTGWIFEPNDRDKAISMTLDIAQSPAGVDQVATNARQYIVTQRQWTHNVLMCLEAIDVTPPG